MTAGNRIAADSPTIRYFYGANLTELTRLVFSIFPPDAILPDLSEPYFPRGDEGDLLKARRVLVGEGTTVPSNFRTTTGAQVLLTWLPGSGTGFEYDPTTEEYYEVLVGDFSLSVGEGASTDPSGTAASGLMCGISGVEFFQIEDAARLRFVKGLPAYAPGFMSPNALFVPEPLVANLAGVTEPVETTYLFVFRAGENTPYFSQAEQAPFYEVGATQGFLDFLPIPYASVPPPASADDTADSFPMVPYGGLTATQADIAQDFERQVLSPLRSRRIQALVEPTPRLARDQKGPRGLGGPQPALVVPGSTCLSSPKATRFAPIAATGMTGATGMPGLACRPAPVGPTGPSATTNRGTLLYPGPTADRWDALRLGQSDHGARALELRGVQDHLRRAMLTNQTFLVISNPRAFADGYEYLQAALKIQGWNFDLCPDIWGEHSTILIFKFANGSLADLAADLNAWTDAETFNSAVYAKQNQILGILTDSAAQSSPDFDHFNQVVNDPSWSGLLALNVFVPLDALPPQLAGLAAGIDPSAFFAHHLGINLSPVEERGEQLVMQDSSLFGLIYYESLSLPVDNGAAYQFKVLVLDVLFVNSAIVSFSSQIALYIDQLFGEEASLTPTEERDFELGDEDLDPGHNIVLNGIYQRSLTGDASKDSYLFTWRGNNDFYPVSQVVERVTLQQAEFVTVVDAEPGDSDPVVSRFQLWGNMGFYQLDFDIYAFDSLSFANLIIQMEFPSENPAATTFAFEAGQMALDAGTSSPRPGSVPANFPLRVQGMVQGGSDSGTGEASTPAAAGFINVQSPLPTMSLGSIWWGLSYSLDLGSQGALAAKASFKATLLAAWGVDTDEPVTSLGLQLPGSTGSSPEVTIQGPLKIAMSSIQLAAAAGGGKPYVLRFNDMAVKFLSLSLPTSGTTNMYLFGDPLDTASRTLGWYAAYQKDDSKDGGDGDGNGETREPMDGTPPRQLTEGAKES